MHITYLIGNGFDLACGLKTKYTDMYNKYCMTDSPNENIKNFKETILENYETWADFEMALPEFGKKLGDFEKFKECVLDFVGFLEDYLNEEQNKVLVDPANSELARQLQSYLYHFYKYCLQRSNMTLKRIVQETNESVRCHFITFNYTDTLEKCLSVVGKNVSKHGTYSYQYETPIHIHNTLYNGILLGLDNEDLYKSIPCDDIRRLKNLIDKVYSNDRYSDIKDKCVEILKQSRVIIIFGWSMGGSDSFWVHTVKKLFSANSGLHLVYVPYYKEPANKRFRNQSLDREDEQKDYITEKFGIPEAQRDRVHIVTDAEYMKLDFLADSNQKELLAI